MLPQFPSHSKKIFKMLIELSHPHQAENVKSKSLNRVTQSVALCDPMDSTTHGILQARILEWVAVPFSKAENVVILKTSSCSAAQELKHFPKTKELASTDSSGGSTLPSIGECKPPNIC